MYWIPYYCKLVCLYSLLGLSNNFVYKQIKGVISRCFPMETRINTTHGFNRGKFRKTRIKCFINMWRQTNCNHNHVIHTYINIDLGLICSVFQLKFALCNMAISYFVFSIEITVLVCVHTKIIPKSIMTVRKY